MADGEQQQFTIYDHSSNQPMTVTVNNVSQGSEDAQAVQNIQYITSDGVSVTPLGSNDVIQVIEIVLQKFIVRGENLEEATLKLYFQP